MERRNFIRALIGVTIGVPIAIEGVTFATLFYERLTGKHEERDRPADQIQGEGDELLPGTQPSDSISELSVVASSETEWTYRLAVAVENTTEDPYRLKLGPLSLTDGETVGDTISSGSIDPGESTTVTAEWSIASGSTVDAIWVGGKVGTAESVTELVPLERIEPSG